MGDTLTADAWRPIVTAPKEEGAEYIVRNDRGTFCVAFDISWVEDGWWMVSDGKDFERPLRGNCPTHWMPLPPPPLEEARG